MTTKINKGETVSQSKATEFYPKEDAVEPVKFYVFKVADIKALNPFIELLLKPIEGLASSQVFDKKRETFESTFPIVNRCLAEVKSYDEFINVLINKELVKYDTSGELVATDNFILIPFDEFYDNALIELNKTTDPQLTLTKEDLVAIGQKIKTLMWPI